MTLPFKTTPEWLRAAYYNWYGYPDHQDRFYDWLFRLRYESLRRYALDIMRLGYEGIHWTKLPLDPRQPYLSIRQMLEREKELRKSARIIPTEPDTTPGSADASPSL